MSRRTYTPKHSTVVAYLALFSSLATGGAFAAIQLAPNSVGSRQIRTHAIQLSDLSPAAVRALRGQVGQPGPQGATGPQGPVGATGATGQINAANIVQRETVGPVVTRPGDGRFIGAECALDERVLGGGGSFTSATTTAGVAPPAITLSAPAAKERQWDVAFTDTTAGGQAHAFAICLKP